SGDIQYIDISSVNQGTLSGYTRYEINEAPSRARRMIKPNDIIYSTVRPNLKAYYYVKDDCPKNAIASTGFAVIRATQKSDSRFIYYLITENSFVDYLSMVAKGSAYPAVDTNDFKKAKIKLPPLPVQQKIADILSAYDDLIENNNRRIEILEKAAESLYKEWFVRFRFPNYKETKFENGLPQGWKVVKLGELVEIKGGKRLPVGKTLINEPNKHPYIKIKDIKNSKFLALDNDFEYVDDETQRAIKQYITNTNDILISIVGTIGLVCVVDKSLNNANLTENCAKLVNLNEVNYNYIYHFLSSDFGKSEIAAGIVGATQPKLPLYNIKRIKLLKPNKELLNKFDNIIEIFNRQIRRLETQNRNLIKQRDLLLPRLMSGKLEV
ncbi:MAG: restriction endonuclease subunit S, partial [Clostridium sp.]|nr:restriction endonuclease subunit S [Clostridium sp.]